MTNKQLHLLKTLSVERETQLLHTVWTIQGLCEEDVEELQELGYIFVDIGEGYVGEVENLSLSAAGHDFIKDFCTTCECMPCDCNWGYE